jgi:hypothetical protein
MEITSTYGKFNAEVKSLPEIVSAFTSKYNLQPGDYRVVFNGEAVLPTRCGVFSQLGKSVRVINFETETT